MVLIVAAPWFIAFAYLHPELAAEFFFKHNVGRFVAAFDHVQSWWYYLPGLALSLSPWMLFLRRHFHIDRFAAAAALLCIAFFSASACKRPGYMLSAYPAMAVALAGPVAARWRDSRNTRWALGIAGILTAIGVLLALPAYAERNSLRDAAHSISADVAAGTPVVCYERPCDGVAFYLQLQHLPAYSTEHRNELIRDLASRPATLLIGRNGATFDKFIDSLPADMHFARIEKHAGTVIGRLRCD